MFLCTKHTNQNLIDVKLHFLYEESMKSKSQRHAELVSASHLLSDLRDLPYDGMPKQVRHDVICEGTKKVTKFFNFVTLILLRLRTASGLLQTYKETPLFHGIKSSCPCDTAATSTSPLATFIT